MFDVYEYSISQTMIIIMHSFWIWLVLLGELHSIGVISIFIEIWSIASIIWKKLHK